MDFQRIDKNTVQCRMTEEEMNEYGFEIEDFFTNQEKSREFLEQIVERAEEEVGYEVESGMISMQLMRMPDNSLTITFSDRGEDGLQSMLHHIQNLAGMIDESSISTIMEGLNQELRNVQEGSDNELHTSDREGLPDFGDTPPKERRAAYQKHLKEIEKIKNEKEKKIIAASKIFKFSSLRDLESFAATVVYEKPVSSRLYKDEEANDYYLLVKKGKLKFDEYKQLCQRLSEYAVLCSQRPYFEQHCKEHFECIIPKHALKILKEY